MEIQYPEKQSEFEIQATLFNKLVSLGYDVRGEVTYRDLSAKKGFKQSRFDVVLFKDKKAILIIEVKNYKKENFETRQDIKYRGFGIDVVYLSSLEGIDDLVSYIITCG